ncbi:hypothetical protein ILYODFUR_028922, partial [Ilyodon furcidens]
RSLPLIMRLPNSYLHFGPIQTQNVILGTSQYQDQADQCKELKKWVTQQEEELRRIYGEEVEILPSPLLLQVMEGARGRQPTPVSPVFIPGRIRSSLPRPFPHAAAVIVASPPPHPRPVSCPRSPQLLPGHSRQLQPRLSLQRLQQLQS